MSEWLINYQGGFTRRGLLGEISIYIATLLNLKLRIIIFLFQATAYLIYLAWKMLGSLKVGNQETGSPLKFYQAVTFQFVNPKAWVICITAVSLFLPREENLPISILFLVLLSSAVNLPCISCWALFGATIRNFLKNKKIKIVIEWLMALVLVLTSASILFG